MEPGGVVSQSLPVTPETRAAASLRPGQLLAGIIRESPEGGLLLRAAGQSFPISAAAGLQDGQPVQVRVVEQSGRLLLQLSGLPGAGPAPQPGSIDTLGPLVQAMGSLAAAQSVGARLPGPLAARSDWVQQLAAAWFGQPDDAAQLAEWSGLLRQAQTGAAWRPPAVLAAWLNASGDDATAWASLLKAFAPGALAERRLARGVASGRVDPAVAQDFRSAVAALLGDDALLEALDGPPARQRFLDLTRAVADRLDRAALADTLALDGRYAFWDLPVFDAGAMPRARIHWIGSSQGGDKSGRSQQEHRVALDVELSRLGPLWIELRRTPSRCSCRLRAADPETLRRLREDTAALAGRLRAVTGGAASVQMTRWHGDRARSLAGWFDEAGPR